MKTLDLIEKIIISSNNLKNLINKSQFSDPESISNCNNKLNESWTLLTQIENELNTENKENCVVNKAPINKNILEEKNLTKPKIKRESSELNDELLAIILNAENKTKLDKTSIEESPVELPKTASNMEEDEDSCYLEQINKLETSLNYQSPMSNKATPARQITNDESNHIMDDELRISLLKQFDEEEDENEIAENPDQTVQAEIKTEEDDDFDQKAPENQKYIAVLKKYFGYNTFRKPQLGIIKKTIEDKRDQLVVMATGRGKSLCYQFPALYLSGLTIVISPLISLMEDQVMSLSLLNVEACLLGSAQKETSSIEQSLLEGKYKVLYITPEYINTSPDLLITIDQKVGINLLAIDECHCVSQWGNDFRPAYRKIGKLRKQLKSTPVIALTATATPSVRRDILLSLNLNNPIVTVTSFDRPNLYLSVSLKSNSIIKDLKQFMVEDSDHKFNFNGPTIIYCQTKKSTTETMNALKAIGIKCEQYHAGLKLEERKKTHFDFINDKISVITATVAFGMGIDKPDIRNIIHYGAPKEMESYYQEIGRAGRDGEPSKCHIFYESKDFMTARYFLNQIVNETFRSHKSDMLAEMQKFLTTSNCRRLLLLNHFEENKKDSCDLANQFKNNCCDNCTSRLKSASSPNGQIQMKDYTQEAKKIVTCVKLVNEKFGINLVISYLLGSKSQKLTAKLHESLFKNQYFGCGKSKSEGWWKLFAQQLINEGYLGVKNIQTAYGSYPISILTQKGRDLIDDKIKQVKFYETSDMKKISSTTITSSGVAITTGSVSNPTNFILPSVPVHQIVCSSATNKAPKNKELKEGNLETELYKLLIKVRGEMVEEFGLSAHKICTNKALSSLAYTRPSTIQNLEQVDDFPANAQKIGAKFIENIVLFCKKFKLKMDSFTNMDETVSTSTASSVSINDPKVTELLHNLSEKKQASYIGFEIENKSLEEVSMERKVGVSTIVGHLEDAILVGLPINFTRLGVTPDKIDRVETVIRAPPINSNVNKLTTIKEQIPDLSWDDLKICLSLLKRKFGVGIVYSEIASNQPVLSVVKNETIQNGNQSHHRAIPNWLNKRPSQIEDDAKSAKNEEPEKHKKKPKLNL